MLQSESYNFFMRKYDAGQYSIQKKQWAILTFKGELRYNLYD